MSKIAAILFPLLIPPLVFGLCAVLAGLSVGETATALVDQYSQRRQNLLMMGVLGLVPMIPLAIVVVIYRKLGGTARAGRAMAWGGILMASLVLLWVNFSYWPSYFPSRVAPMWPHGLEFVIGPLFFAPIAMIPGVLAGWFWARRS